MQITFNPEDVEQMREINRERKIFSKTYIRNQEIINAYKNLCPISKVEASYILAEQTFDGGYLGADSIYKILVAGNKNHAD